MLLVFGSTNVDDVFHLERLPLPGETLLADLHQQFAGGKGANQAVAACRLKIPTLFYGCVGDDSGGTFLKKALTSEPLHLRLQETHRAPTGRAFIGVDQKAENFIVVSKGANQHLKAECVTEDDLDASNFILMQMEIDVEENMKLAKRGKRKNKTLVMNYAPSCDVHPNVLNMSDVLIVNEHELQMIAEAYNVKEKSVEGVCMHVARALQSVVVATLGKEGAIAVDGPSVYHQAAYLVTPKDTTGAGDAFSGTFAGCLSVGLSLEEALKNAVTVAGLSCTKNGAQASYPTLESVLNESAFIMPQPR